MLLLSVSTYEVGRFLQIAGLISLPIIVITLSVIAWLHYRKKKLAAFESETMEPVFWIEPPGESTVLKMNGPVRADNGSAMLYQCTQKLHAQHHLYEALQERYKKLQYEYEVAMMSNEKTLIRYNQLREEKMNQQQMKDNHNVVTEKLQQEIDEKEAELNEMEIIINDLQHRITDLESVEIPAVRQTLPPTPTIENHMTTEEKCLQDLLNEKQAQVDFLQQQLNIRIRNYHEAEQQLQSIREQNIAAMRDLEQQLTAANHQLQKKNDVLRNILQQASGEVNEEFHEENEPVVTLTAI